MVLLKGQCHDIFCAFFCASKNGGCSRKCRGHQTWKLSRPCGRPPWPPTLAADMTVPWTNDKSSQSCTASLVDGDRQHFVFRLRGPCKVISPSSRFKISSGSCIDIDSLFSCLVLRAFRSLLWRSRRREHGGLGEGIGGVVVAPFPVTLTMCVTVKANALNEERVRETDVDVRADTGFVLAFAQYMTNTWRLKKRTCGKLWGRPGRRSRRCTFEHCTSCCPSKDATMVVLTKKNAKRRLPLHKKDLLRVGAKCRKRDVLSSSTLAANRVSPPVSKRQNNHLAPSCRLSLKKLLRRAWPRSERGHPSAVRGLPMNFRDLSWWPPLFFPTQNG